MRIISIFSYRGNVGKTVLASSLAIKLYEKGYNIGILDFDLLTPGGLAMLFNKVDLDLGIVDMLLDDVPLNNIIIDISYNNRGNKLYLIPAILNIEKIIRVIREGCSFKKLKDMLCILKGELDILIVDTHAGFTEDTITMLTLSDLILLILRYDYQDLVGTRIATSILKKMGMPVLSIVNMVPKNNLIREVLDYVESKIGLRPILAIPFYIELLEFMMSRSVQNFIYQHKQFANDIERLASIVEVKLNDD